MVFNYFRAKTFSEKCFKSINRKCTLIESLFLKRNGKTKLMSKMIFINFCETVRTNYYSRYQNLLIADRTFP